MKIVTLKFDQLKKQIGNWSSYMFDVQINLGISKVNAHFTNISSSNCQSEQKDFLGLNGTFVSHVYNGIVEDKV